VVLKLNSNDGFMLRTEVVPLPGSPSAGRTKVLPYALDPKMVVPDDRATFAAFGEPSTGVLTFIDALTSSGPKGKVVGKHLRGLLTEIVGGGSCVLPAAIPLANLCAFPLRPGVTPDRALGAYTAMMKDMQGWQDELLGPKKSKIKFKRSKDLLEMEISMSNPDPATRAMQRAMWGGDSQKYVLAIRDGRVVQAQGIKPREVLERWGTGTAAVPPIFASTLARTKGAEVLIYSDLVALIASGIKAAQEPSLKQAGAMMGAVPGLADLKAPLVIALWGGKTTALELHFPIQTLTNIAQVVRPFMGMMGAGAAPPPPPPAK
jgi:hypothetical protein